MKNNDKIERNPACRPFYLDGKKVFVISWKHHYTLFYARKIIPNISENLQEKHIHHFVFILVSQIK